MSLKNSFKFILNCKENFHIQVNGIKILNRNTNPVRAAYTCKVLQIVWTICCDKGLYIKKWKMQKKKKQKKLNQIKTFIIIIITCIIIIIIIFMQKFDWTNGEKSRRHCLKYLGKCFVDYMMECDQGNKYKHVEELSWVGWTI